MRHFDEVKCSTYISQSKWEDASQMLKSFFHEHVNCISPDDLKKISRFAKAVYFNAENTHLFLLELFRVLRNSTITRENQDALSNMDSLLIETKNILIYITSVDGCELLTKVVLQFLINLIVMNKKSAVKVSKILYNEVLDCLLQKKNEHEVLALLYNLHLQNEDLCMKESMYMFILETLNENSSEYAQFLTELFLYDENFWLHYNEFGVSLKILVLELLKHLWLEKKLKKIPDIAIQTLSSSFCSSSNVIFQTVSSSTECLEPYEVCQLLDNLGCFCGDETYLKILQNDHELVIRSGAILINVHRLGKQSENYFTSVQKLSELKEPNEAIQKHPAFGFKVGLVRLIGNLCWKNKKVQDLVREAEIIPVLLDCCNIDARNPLIMQWVILAIRNLCEKNSENQAFIAELHKEGVVSSALIEEMGLTLHGDEDGKIRIVPLALNNE